MDEKPHWAVVVLLVAVTTPLGVWLQGTALRYLWRLYIEPIFGIDVPSLIACVGLSMVANYLVHPHGSPLDNDDIEPGTYRAYAKAVVKSVVVPLVVMFVGWLLSLFM